MAKPDEPDPAIAPGQQITFEVTWAPWLRLYRAGVLWFSSMTGHGTGTRFGWLGGLSEAPVWKNGDKNQ